MTKEEFIKGAKRVRGVMRAMTNGMGHLEMALSEDPTLKDDIDFWRKKYTEGGRFSQGSEAADLALMEKYLFDGE